MILRILLSGIVISACTSFASTAAALNQLTHALINEHAARQSSLDGILKSRLGVPEGQEHRFRGKSVLVLLREGGIYEDDGIRFFRHFHDPLRPWTSAGLSFFGQYQSSIHWMQRPTDPTNCQEWTWSSARCYFYQALTSGSPDAWVKTFRAIGQLMHLVVDASVPEHTRNDPHPLGGLFGSYEYWVQGLHVDAEEERDFIAKYLATPIRPDARLVEQPTDDAEAPVPIARLIDTDIYTGADPNVTLTPLIGIAEFANANFFSEDSGYRRFLAPNYPHPSVEALLPSMSLLPAGSRVRAYYQKGPGDGQPVDPVLAECALDAAFRDDGILTPQYKCADKNVWEQTALSMLPRAVGYAAALIDYFFRGSLAATYENQSLRISGSPEAMVGDFELLYERADGARAQLATWTALQVDPGQPSQPLSTPQLPGDAAPEAPCWLIFRGQLGLEPGAVVGSQAPCPPAPPPPSGGWYVYSCVLKRYGSMQDVRYNYATTSPPLWSDGLPALIFFLGFPTGTTSCSLMAQGLATQPPGTTTEHVA